MNLEDYNEYYIQGSDHYLIPKDVFKELFNEMVNWKEEVKELKKQLEYLRSGEYYNQLRFENVMLQQAVDTKGVPSEVYDYIDCTHRNTELLEENQELKLELSGYRQAILDDKEMLGLKEKNQKYKEVIDKIMNLIKKYGKYDGKKCTRGFQMWSADFNKILDILKEVSDEKNN